jgi:D-alanine-D-alanine ligase
MADLALRPVPDLTDDGTVWTWETKKGLADGTLLVAHLDVPAVTGMPAQRFRREPEWLYGEGIGTSRAPLTMLEYALRALRSLRLLRRTPLGVLLYADEGRDARDSAAKIREAAGRASRVLVLRPGNPGDHVITRRRGQRRYRLRVEGDPRRPGRAYRRPDILRWTCGRIEELSALSGSAERVSVSALKVETEALPGLLPHRVAAQLLTTYPDSKAGDALEQRMRDAIPSGPRWELDPVSDRPAMEERRSSKALARSLAEIASEWDIGLKFESSTWPSAAGLVPPKIPCLCGVGPVARDLGTPHESIQRISLIQRTLLLAQLLAEKGEG